MPAREAASRTTSQSTFGVIPLPQTRPVLLIDRKSAPSVMRVASFPLPGRPVFSDLPVSGRITRHPERIAADECVAPRFLFGDDPPRDRPEGSIAWQYWPVAKPRSDTRARSM